VGEWGGPQLSALIAGVGLWGGGAGGRERDRRIMGDREGGRGGGSQGGSRRSEEGGGEGDRDFRRARASECNGI
jgi:hypothetical protein